MELKIEKNNNTLVQTCSELDLDSLSSLLDNQTCVLRIPSYCEQLVCDAFVRWLSSNENLNPCLNEIREKQSIKYVDYGVDSNTICFNTTYSRSSDDEECTRYYSSALSNIRIPRHLVSPRMTPVDRLRLELDEIWPYGAMIANFNGKKNTVGLFRVVQANRSPLLAQSPHVDSLPLVYQNLTDQFTANIYFQLPCSGGELEVWAIPPLSGCAIDECQQIPNWRERLPDPVVIRPKPGELVLFNARRPHCVCDFSKGIRVSVQFFIGIDEGKKLILWS